MVKLSQNQLSGEGGGVLVPGYVKWCRVPYVIVYKISSSTLAGISNHIYHILTKMGPWVVDVALSWR